MSKKEPAERETQVIYMERRPIAGGHRGLQVDETRIVQGDSVPPGARQMPEGTALHDWVPGRTWLPDAGPHGIEPGG